MLSSTPLKESVLVRLMLFAGAFVLPVMAWIDYDQGNQYSASVEAIAAVTLIVLTFTVRPLGVQRAIRLSLTLMFVLALFGIALLWWKLDFINQVYFRDQLTATGIVINGAIVTLFLVGLAKMVVSFLFYHGEERALLQFLGNFERAPRNPLEGVDPDSIIYRRFATLKRLLLPGPSRGVKPAGSVLLRRKMLVPGGEKGEPGFRLMRMPPASMVLTEPLSRKSKHRPVLFCSFMGGSSYFGPSLSRDRTISSLCRCR